jgi:hypothetical protein
LAWAWGYQHALAFAGSEKYFRQKGWLNFQNEIRTSFFGVLSAGFLGVASGFLGVFSAFLASASFLGVSGAFLGVSCAFLGASGAFFGVSA